MALEKAKKGGLTLAQLASYDDVLTDALVDRVCSCNLRSGFNKVAKVS